MRNILLALLGFGLFGSLLTHHPKSLVLIVIIGLVFLFIKRRKANNKTKDKKDYILHLKDRNYQLGEELNTAKDELKTLRQKTVSKNDKSIEKASKINADNIKSLEKGIQILAEFYIKDSLKYITSNLTVSNLETQKTRLQKVIDRCEKEGAYFSLSAKQTWRENLIAAHALELEKQQAKDEQARLREIMREEQAAEKERKYELKRIEAEEKALETKKKENEERMEFLRSLQELQQISEAQKLELDEASKENDQLIQKLAEKERAKSMAELTKAGNVYVISNIGSFGENVFKIGMTRRLIPEDRINELSDASVPFPFDIHMMIPCEDAPSLESKIHEQLWDKRVNRLNKRKEFFKVSFQEILTTVKSMITETNFEICEIAKAEEWRFQLVPQRMMRLLKWSWQALVHLSNK